jgi:hypothetical protein
MDMIRISVYRWTNIYLNWLILSGTIVMEKERTSSISTSWA